MSAPAVVLVADAGPAAGLGHLSRTGALAAALTERGVDCACFAAGVAEGFDRDGLRWEPLAEVDAEVLVLDSYELDLNRFKADRLVVFADDDDPRRGADLIVNTGLPESAERPELLGGPEHACLRPAFWNPPRREPRTAVESVLVTTGGGPTGGEAAPLAAAVRDALPDAAVTLVRGPGVEEPPPEGVDTLDAPETLAPAFAAADLAVVTAGQSLLEACALGTPALAIVAAENQRGQAERLRERGAVELLDAGDPPQVARALASLAADPDRRRALSEAAQRAVDGRGAVRVAERIAALVR